VGGEEARRHPGAERRLAPEGGAGEILPERLLLRAAGVEVVGEEERRPARRGARQQPLDDRRPELPPAGEVDADAAVDDVRPGGGADHRLPVGGVAGQDLDAGRRRGPAAAAEAAHPLSAGHELCRQLEPEGPVAADHQVQSRSVAHHDSLRRAMVAAFVIDSLPAAA